MTVDESRDALPWGGTGATATVVAIGRPADGSVRCSPEWDGLAQRLRVDHPDVAPAVLDELLDRAIDDLADARVQNFKLILVERAVRRGLADR